MSLMVGHMVGHACLQHNILNHLLLFEIKLWVGGRLRLYAGDGRIKPETTMIPVLV